MSSLNRTLFVAYLALSLLACSKGNDNAPNINPVTGKHPSGWAVDITGGKHPDAYIAGPSACFECHGKNMNGGISGVSCFTASLNGINCHTGGPSGHTAGWSAPSAHGASAKAIALGRDGFAHCQICHGTDYAGGSAKKSCLASAGCHGAGNLAPHSAKPWRSNIGGRTHTTTDVSNASACALCHSAGANSSRKPDTAQAGTVAGCFNNTLCHGVEGHAAGWSAPGAHGAAAMSPAGGGAGFSSCAVCHGAQYDGGTALQTCLSTTICHGVAAPHAAKPWRSTTGGASHVKTDTSNAGQCAICHTGGANSSRAPRAGDPTGLTGCYNNTLCHGLTGHPVGWQASSQHGAAAKKAPTATTGFSSCQLCHGPAFTNGAAVTCLNNAACHGSGVYAPHPRKPWFSAAASTHTNTDSANAGTCAICHTAGANSTVKPPAPATLTIAGCFNNTLCHFHQIPFAPSATIPPSLHGSEAKKDLTVCQHCHGTVGTTAFDGLALADGTKTTACSDCHTSAKAHPTDWQGSGTYSHRTAGNRADACSICHDVTQGLTGPLAQAPSCFSTAFTNGLGQARTCHASGPGVSPHGVPYNNHNATARTNFPYCLGCHQIAADVTTTGGVVIPRCLTCHLLDPQANPNNCVSCHAKPPNGSVYPNIAKSHASHNALNVTNVCAECHSGLGLGTVDHLNRSRLRTTAVQANPVAFGVLAKTGGLTPSYNSGTGECSTTYCHGGSLAGGSNKLPLWGQTGYNAGCGTCHGFPPPNTAHNGVTSSTPCAGCHRNVNVTNNGFIDPTKHINGILEVTTGAPHAVPYPGVSHAAAGATIANCSGCHNTTDPGVYPTPGVAPNCRACHISSLGVGCTDCHSTPPNGTVAPNRNFAHTSHNNATIACAVCHVGGGTGTTQHGYGTTTVAFSPFVRTGGLTPVYTAATKQCANIYCHGNTLDKPASAILSPVWSTPFPTGVHCSLCHGYPPATATHTGLVPTDCKGCHLHVNAAGTGFDNPALHINGVIDVQAIAHGVPYLSHNTAATASCLKPNGGCHNTGTGGTAYPLVKDSVTGAPDCMSCHTLADPLATGNGLGNCRSCHGTGGTATTAPPTGTIWPNIRGSNTSAQHPSHQGSACGDCHPGVSSTGLSTTNAAGSGSGVNHGPNKNRLSGTIQTNSTQTVIGITPNVPRGTGSTCNHSNLPNANCHGGPGTQTWTAP